MKKFLHSRKGVTLLEGLIALLLLAVVATGTFGVLLSTSRKSSGPDLREEMSLAVLRAKHDLEIGKNSIDAGTVYSGPCENDLAPFDDISSHNINCLLPPICDRNTSSFTYDVVVDQCINRTNVDQMSEDFIDFGICGNATDFEYYKLEFDITCNGFTL